MIYLVLINLVTPKARAKHEPFVQQIGLWYGPVLSLSFLDDYGTNQIVSCLFILYLIISNHDSIGLCSSGTVVELSTYNPSIKGSNPTT